ncbi:hypothetical protein CDS [Bradyrhizobium sp.]|nr:hypothetical protein CDS [Bradyrhizobium sp.]
MHGGGPGSAHKPTTANVVRQRVPPSTAVIARESGRSSIPEAPVIPREAAAYWIPRLRGE